MLERGIGEYLFERGAHGCGGQDIAGQGAPHTSDIDEIRVWMVLDHLRDALGDAVGTGGDPTADALANDQDVRVKPPGSRATAGAGRDGVRLINKQEGAVLAAQIGHTLEEARLRQDDADVGQRRLHDEHRHVTVCQGTLDGGEVVEFQRARRIRDSRRCPDVALTYLGLAIGAHLHEGLVDRAVVAVRKCRDLGSVGHHARQTQCPAVGVGGSEGKGPQRQAEAAGQIRSDPLRICTRHHCRDATLDTDALLHRLDRGLRRVSCHRAGVTQCKIDVLTAIDIGDAIATCGGEIDRMTAGPLIHPGHRNATKKMIRLVIESLRPW